MGKRKNAKKQGEAVVAVVVADATNDVSANTDPGDGAPTSKKKHGNAVVAVAVADATKDVPVDTSTETIARKSKRKQGKAVVAEAVVDATEDVPADTATSTETVARMSKRKQGKAVVAVAVVDATKDVPADTATETVAQKKKKKKKQGKAVKAAAMDATDDVPANAATDKVVPTGEGLKKRKNKGEGTDNEDITTSSKKKSKKTATATATAIAAAANAANAAAENESEDYDDNLHSAVVGNFPTATKDGNDFPSNKKLPAITGGSLSTAEMDSKSVADGDNSEDGNDVPPNNPPAGTGDSSSTDDEVEDSNDPEDAGNDVPADGVLYSDRFEYDPPFNFYHRYIPSNQWNKDPDDNIYIRPVEIYPVTGSRKKREVKKDTFDWLLPPASTIDASRESSSEAYSTEFKFHRGFVPSNKMRSKSYYCVPNDAEEKFIQYQSHSVAMVHPQCNIEQDTEWLIKSVGKLITRIEALRPETRSSLQDASSGRNIFKYASYVKASEFVCPSDDVLLIDMVQNNNSKLIWHCSNVFESDMLCKTIIAAYAETVGGDERYPDKPQWFLELESQKISKPSKDKPPLQFLGLVSLFQTQNRSKVSAFIMHSFVMYRFDPKTKATQVKLLMCQTDLSYSSIQERLLQIVQLVQGELVSSSRLVLVPDFIVPPDAVASYEHSGFSILSYESRSKKTILTRKTVIKMAHFTNRCLWARFGKYLSFPSESDKDSPSNFVIRIFGHFLLRPIDHNASINKRFPTKKLEGTINQAAKTIEDMKTGQLERCLRGISILAQMNTQIPLAIFSHAVVNRLKPTKLVHHIYETTLELIQYVSIKMVQVDPRYISYTGDMHQCVLFCEKCQASFGNRGNICKVLLEASDTILYHHGLELREPQIAKENDDNGVANERFKQSLPMRSMARLSGFYSMSVIDALDKLPLNQRCSYGTGQQLTTISSEKEHKFLASLCEATMIDAYYSGDTKTVQKRQHLTHAFLLSLFDVHLVRFAEDTASMTIQQFRMEDYASQVNDALVNGTEWIMANNKEPTVPHHRILQGWCLLLSQSYLLNYSYFSRMIYRQLVSSLGEKVPFSLDELLAGVGLESTKSEDLYSHCMKYDLSSEMCADFECRLCDIDTHIPITTALLDRPVQETVHNKPLDQRGTIALMGKGWTRDLCLSWFCHKASQTKSDRKVSTTKSDIADPSDDEDDEDDKDDEDVEDPSVVATQDSSGIKKKKKSPYQPPTIGRTITSALEAEESQIIMKTLATVHIDYDTRYGKGYTMTCNVKRFGIQYPHLKSRHKDFFANPSFACSESMILSLPFAFVKTVTKLKTETSDAKEYPLPADWRAMVKKDASRSSDGNIKSIQLWRHRTIFKKKGGITVNRIFKVEYNQGQHEFLTEAVATFYLKKEPWILEPVYHLCSVRNYRKVVFGEGAKTSQAHETHHHDTTETGRPNVWYCTDNHSKLCSEGSVCNLLHHMHLSDDANLFRGIAVNCTIDGLKKAMKTDVLPKRILLGHEIDPFEKCIWILETRFNCRRMRPVNLSRLNTSTAVVQFLHKLKLPVLLSVVGHGTFYNHVVVAWRNEIIDFETSHTYAVTFENIENICGVQNPFVRICRACVICPSKAMKRAVGDLTDWGEKTAVEDLSHWFTNTKK